MRLVRNVKLFFREGNSDKTYEIDLCEVGPEQYTVNFRYGKRFGTLKEGTKTVTPVALAAATTIFDALEKEKRGKGYLGEQEAVQDLSFVPVDTSQVSDPQNAAILKRLQGAVENKPAYKTKWKTSRVIWKAGERKIKEAVPYLIKLVEKGDAMQRYTALWALGKCGDPAAAPVLRSYADNGSYALNIRMLAANGLLMVLPEEERNAHIQSYLLRLPESLQQVIAGGNAQEIFDAAQQLVLVKTELNYPLLEDLYIVAYSNKAVRDAVIGFLVHMPLRPSYFQHIRHIFKQAELRDDQGVVGTLAVRFERELPMFNHPGKRLDYDGNEYHPNVYVAEVQEYFKIAKEIKKPGSRLSYSNKTRNYLKRRVLRNLRAIGKRGDLEYVRLATALLLQYEEQRDAKQEYQTRQYSWVNGRYTTWYRQFPAHSRAVFLNYILRGNAPNMKLDTNGTEWYFEEPKDNKGNPTQEATTLREHPDTVKAQQKGTLIQKLFGWLGGEKQSPSPGVVPPAYKPDPAPAQEGPVSDVPFLELWQQMPQAFIQLLITGRMEAVHLFAMEQLKAHPDYADLKSKMDEQTIYYLLISHFNVPALFGLELAKEKYNPANLSFFLLYAVTMSPLEVARIQGLDWVDQNKAACFGDTDFLMRLIFNPYQDVRNYVRKFLTADYLPMDKARALVGKSITALMASNNLSEEVTHNLNDGCQILEQFCGDALREVDITVVTDLMNSEVPACQALGVRLLVMKQGQLNFADLSDQLFRNLTASRYESVRMGGIAVLQAMPEEELLRRPELLLDMVLATYTDVRKGVRPLIAKLIAKDSRLAVYLVNELVPRLMRKETEEGIHDDIASILSNELVGHLQDVDTATALRLLYANYRAAQEFGVLVLNKYIPAEALTIKQVIAAGNHELLAVREWCWGFYNQHVARLRYERDAAIGLLDAKWEDTRRFAQEFFRTQFTENDWTPETLVAIADSVRPDIQAFGREMLMRFFKEADGASYLLKLSQHPSVAMQVFATNYLETYAAGNLEYLRSMEHYFRAVLSRVNKARVAKERIFSLLEKEALKSPEAAAYIGEIIAHISATVAIADKARCIQIMHNIQQQFEVSLPITLMPVRTHVI
ncbi:HEAT repeat domain-containing protein [Chitinophaga qingshengii]|uniref:HEAT repeat domain-containing protein n=1 Tax=Chitinophaga qingshengii TaxID=1569794 RepID=A0ABR7TH07_9BACT|nr:HEAT repeat domain-containing protein [Chitinophaga qingshengii]MBC9928767.1 HEAT repeat domain-containing protein [Chitinophaga qingshengii]